MIHGATGAQGAPVLHALRLAGHSGTAAVRDASKVEGEAISVDFSSVDSLVAAYTNAAGVFIHLPLASPEEQREFARTIVAALERARPARVVFSTSGYSTLHSGSAQSPHGILADFLNSSDLSYAIVEPRLYLENLLLPPVMSGVKDEGILRYPLKNDYAVSWSSHLDVADVVSRLLLDHSVSGTVAIGALPGLIGADLAAGFSSYFGSDVRFEAITPKDFGVMVTPLFGEAGIAPVVEGYEHRQHEGSDLISQDRSAQRLLGLTPRSVQAWLKDPTV